MTIFGYTIGQAKKAVVAAVIAAIGLVGYFVALPTGFQTAAVVVVGLVFAVVATFKAKNHTADDESKAIMALIGGVVALVGVFTTVPDLTSLEKILTLALPVILHYGVKQTGNAKIAGEHARVHKV